MLLPFLAWLASAVFFGAWLIGDALGDINLIAAGAFCFVLGWLFKELGSHA